MEHGWGAYEYVSYLPQGKQDGDGFSRNSFLCNGHQLPLPEAFISIPYLARAMYLIHPTQLEDIPPRNG